MNTPSEDLYHLIGRLSKTEKTYFKKWASFSGKDENQYLKLFDAIVKQHTRGKYDEIVLKKQFRKEPFIKQFSVIKKYLEESILKALRNYHSRSTPKVEVMHLLLDVGILYEKQAYDLCAKLLTKALNICKKYELFTMHLEIISWEHRIKKWVDITDNTKRNTLDLDSEWKTAILLADKLWDYKYLSETLSFESYKEWKKKGEEKVNHPLMRTDPKLLSFHSRELYYYYYYLYYLRRKNFTKAYKYINDLTSLYENNPHFIDLRPTAYISGLHNKLVVLLGLGNKGTFFTELNKLKSLHLKFSKRNNTRYQIKVLYGSCALELEYYIRHNDIKNGIEFVSQAEKFVKQHWSELNNTQKTMLYSFFSHIYFKAGNFRKALKWNNSFFEAPDSINTNLLSAMNVMKLCVHFELQNFTLIRSLIASYARKKEEKIEKTKMLNIAVNLFKQLLKIMESKEPMNNVKAIEICYNKALIMCRKSENNLFNIFNLSHWIENKITG